MPLVDELIRDDDTLTDLDRSVVKFFYLQSERHTPHEIIDALEDFLDSIVIQEVTVH